MSVLGGFNHVLKEFLSDLVDTFPELGDLKVIKTGVDLLQSVNPRAVLDQFMTYAAPYYEGIFNKNEDFFCNLDNLMKHPEMEAKINDEQSIYFDKMVAFKNVWTTLKIHNKNSIWKYFQSLLKLGAMASTHPEHKVILTFLKQNPNIF